MDAERRKIMKIDSNDFRVHEGHEVNLKKWPTRVESAYKKLLEEHVEQLMVKIIRLVPMTARS